MAEKQIQTSKDMNEPSNFPSLNIISELIKERVEDQLEQVNSLDTKVNFILGSATALIGAGLILQAALLSGSTSTALFLSTKLVHFLPLIILLAVYLCVMISAFFAYRVRAFIQAPNPVRLYEAYLFKKEQETKAAVLRATLEAYERNAKVIHYKVRWINYAFLFLALEVVALAIVLLFETIL